MTIREATLDDIPSLLVLAKHFIEQTEYKRTLAINFEQLTTLGQNLINGPDGVIFISESGGKVTGMMGLLACTQPMSGELVVSDMFWFVEPESRGSAGIRLLRRGERWARATGATSLIMVAPTVRVGKFYKRIGFLHIEAVYHKSLKEKE